jgi:hypothetical protein
VKANPFEIDIINIQQYVKIENNNKGPTPITIVYLNESLKTFLINQLDVGEDYSIG